MARHTLRLEIPEYWYSHHLHTGYTLSPPHDPVRRARELLEACMLDDSGKHDHCQPNKVAPATGAISLPRRLLDLSHDNIILTLDTQDWIAKSRATVDELSRYCTLSYRWGKQPPACMLSTQLTADRVLFLVSMPRTFQDAIVVARGLGVRFIWIDALCIVQPSAHGDDTDWKREGPRMWLVYQNAICTISATCSEQPNDGFLHKVGTDYNPPCNISEKGIKDGTWEPSWIRTGIPLKYASVVASNLNRRGWVAQERLLSRRILHLSEEGVFWECQGTYDDEEINHGDPAGGKKIGHNIGPHHASSMDFGSWLTFIELYSSSKFTLQTDRLIALSSIARCVPIERFGHEYYAGIWGSHLLMCLSWGSETPCSATARDSYLTIAPSWSWASVTGGVQYPSREHGAHSEDLLEIIDVQVSLAEPSNQYGNMKKGALKLRARLCSLSLPTDGDEYDLGLENQCFSDLEEADGGLAWDEYQNPSTAMALYTVIPLGICVDGNEALYDALVITLVPSTSGGDTGDSCAVYRRIGHIHWRLFQGYIHPGHSRSKFQVWTDALFPNAAEQTIVII